MDTSEIYVKMSWQARKHIKKDWRKLSPNQRLGTLICFRSFIGMIINVESRVVDGLMSIMPETLALRIWGNPAHEDLHIIEVDKDFDDEGFPLLRQDQTQEMLKPVELHELLDICGEADGIMWKALHEYAESFEQLWLAFYMHEKHSKFWDGEKWQKK